MGKENNGATKPAKTPEGFTVVRLKDLEGYKRDTSKTAKAVTRAMRATYKNLHGKKAKSA